MDKEALQLRAALIRAARSFFDEQDYLEVDTPLLAPDLIPESCLEVFQTELRSPPGSSRKNRPYWLIPSPEIWMKKILASHKQSVYQICKCFRNGESTGRLHSPEFTMLEFYTVGAGYRVSLEKTEALFSRLLTVPGIFEGAAELLAPPFAILTVDEAFETYAGFSLFDTVEKQGARGLEKEARRLGLSPSGLGVHELYDLIFIHAVEPALPKERPAVLIDYPAFVPCLAQKGRDKRTVERWELYACGVELANCYSEETNPLEVKRFFAEEQAARAKNALIRHNIDETYWERFTAFPPCSGVALGLDRLIMAFSGNRSIDSILPFPME